jgi:hypothetical protein
VVLVVEAMQLLEQQETWVVIRQLKVMQVEMGQTAFKVVQVVVQVVSVVVQQQATQQVQPMIIKLVQI